MSARFLPLILPLLALPALNACGTGGADSPGDAVPDKAALAAVAEKPGVRRAALASALDAMFTRPETSETRAVLVMKDGRIVAERYAPGYHQNTRFVSWSMAKTITAVMIGQLVADGRLSLGGTDWTATAAQVFTWGARRRRRPTVPGPRQPSR